MAELFGGLPLARAAAAGLAGVFFLAGADLTVATGFAAGGLAVDATGVLAAAGFAATGFFPDAFCAELFLAEAGARSPGYDTGTSANVPASGRAS